jgi:hypothetical protein
VDDQPVRKKKIRHSIWTGLTYAPARLLSPRRSPQELKALMEQQWEKGRLANALRPAGYVEPGPNERVKFDEP